MHVEACFIGCNKNQLMMLNETVFLLTMLIMLLMTLVAVNLQFILVCPLCGEAWLAVRCDILIFKIVCHVKEQCLVNT